jgi:protease-4
MPAKKKDHSVFLILLVFFSIILIASLSLFSVSDITGARIAVIPIKGTIMTDASSDFFVSEADAYLIVEYLKAADEDPSTRAVMLDINSPGGSPLASAEIAEAVKNMSKPVVAWIGAVGASGGYYVASAADHIMTHRYSITGSIGAVQYVFQIPGFLDEYGINVTAIKSGDYKDIGSMFRNMTEEDRQVLQEIVDYLYEDFKQVVLTNREGKITQAQLDAIADGRVILGKDAYTYGLVDGLGIRDDAIRKTGELGGIEGYPLIITLEKEEVLYPFSLFGSNIIEGLVELQSTPQLQ